MTNSKVSKRNLGCLVHESCWPTDSGWTSGGHLKRRLYSAEYCTCTVVYQSRYDQGTSYCIDSSMNCASSMPVVLQWTLWKMSLSRAFVTVAGSRQKLVEADGASLSWPAKLDLYWNVDLSGTGQ